MKKREVDGKVGGDARRDGTKGSHDSRFSTITVRSGSAASEKEACPVNSLQECHAAGGLQIHHQE